MHELQRLVAVIVGVEHGPASDGLAARWLAERAPDQVARAFADLLDRAPNPAVRKTLDAFTRALLWGEPGLGDERRRAIRSAAHALGLGAVAALFTEASPALTREGEDQTPHAEAGSSVLTLGHRKQQARLCTDPDRLSRLATDDDPSVIRNLLLNPRLTEARVVRIAARRPATDRVFWEIARSARWGARINVRRALALNPYAPPTLINPLLAQFAAPDLREIAASESLHPAVRDAALALLTLRSP